ncbi:MAG TPA: PilZ domain-containing protein [Methylomirabilota bacterium]
MTRPRCPHCRRDFTRRVARVGVFEHVLSFFYIYPFRCQLCRRRFRGAQIGKRYSRQLVDERAFDRIAIRFPVSFSGAQGGGQGEATALSIDGCTVETDVYVIPGGIVKLSLQVAPRRPPIVIEAAVVRSARPRTLGLHFLRIAPAESERLREFVFEILGVRHS